MRYGNDLGRIHTSLKGTAQAVSAVHFFPSRYEPYERTNLHNQWTAQWNAKRGLGVGLVSEQGQKHLSSFPATFPISG